MMVDLEQGPDLRKFVREHVDGVHAKGGMGGRGALPEPTARLFFRHVLQALRHAHARGFLHCDVKPSNVRLQRARDGGELTAVLQPAERALYPRLSRAPHRPRRAI